MGVENLYDSYLDWLTDALLSFMSAMCMAAIFGLVPRFLTPDHKGMHNGGGKGKSLDGTELVA
jgi:hypothetical protein